MNQDDKSPTSCEEIAPLPADLDEEFNEIYFDLSGDVRERRLEELYSRHPEQAEALRLRMDHLRGADRILLSIDDGARAIQRPQRIGPYRILDEIGQGGFGVVYLAEQDEPIRRQVALKLLLPGVTHTRALERFEAERNVLAMMAHPNIAHVIDAGTLESNQPYFVMEYVSGEPITVFCDHHRLDIPARLNLFLKVCAGVQHAHQKGVLHRDIKPSNTLVAERDGEPVPKIIDFGIAKALQDNVSLIESRTEQGGVLGTPEYMSPEQAGGQPVDARTDIYALGVLLYELLTSRLPFESTELRGRGIAEMARVIRESDPMRASDALRTSPEATERAALNRGLETSQLFSGIRGDLDCILLKTLEKDPDDRYSSVSELAAELQRYLRNEPVLARQPVFSYLARKFVRRHRVAVAAAGVIGLVLILAFFLVVWGIFQIDAARDDAVKRQHDAEFQAYAANISAAKAALDNGDIRSLRRRLAAAPAEFRNWEWDYLDARSDESLAVFDSGGEIVDLVLCPDRAALFATRSDGTLTHLDTTTGKVLYTIPGGGSPRTAAIHPDGSQLVTATRDGPLELWDIASGRLVRKLETDEKHCWCAAFSPDGESLAFSGRDRVVRVMELDSGKVTHTLRGHSDTVLVVEFDETGARLASGGTDRRMILWDLTTGELVREFERHKDHVRCVRFDSRRGQLASLSRDGKIKLFRIDDGELIQTLVWKDVYANEFVFHPDEPSLIAVGGWRGDSKIQAWNHETGAELGTFLGHTSGVMAVSISSDSAGIVTGSLDGTVRTWPLRPEPPVRRLRVGHVFTGLDFHAETRRLVLGTVDGALRCWNTETNKLAWDRATPVGIRELAFDPGGDRVLAVGSDGALYVFDAHTGKKRDGPVRIDTAIENLSASSDGKHLVVAGLDGAAVVLDAVSLQPLHVLPKHAGAVRVAFHPDGTALATADADGKLRLFETRTWSSKWEVDSGQVEFSRIAFSPDGSILASNAMTTTRLTDTRTGDRLHLLEGDEPGFGMCFSSDSRRFVTSGLDRTVRVFEVTRAIELLVLTDAGPTALGFDASGDRLFGVFLGDLYIWTAAK